MRIDVPKNEGSMALPTLKLFPKDEFFQLHEVPLGRKSIDIVCLQRSRPFSVAIELKIKDWRKALWQASVNQQVADESYVAIWHTFVHRAERHCDLLRSYGVGLISVSESASTFVLRSHDPVLRIARDKKREWYEHLLRTA